MKRTPQAPSHLSKIAKTYWKQLAPSVDLQDPSTKALLTLLCDVYSDYWASEHVPTKQQCATQIRQLTKQLQLSEAKSEPSGGAVDFLQ